MDHARSHVDTLVVFFGPSFVKRLGGGIAEVRHRQDVEKLTYMMGGFATKGRRAKG